MRKTIEEMIELLLEALDNLDADPDLEESLGWGVEQGFGPHQAGAYISQHAEFCDLEGDEHDGREPDVDDEPWLGWTAAIDQNGRPGWMGPSPMTFDCDREWCPSDDGIGDSDGLMEQMGMAL